nr:hypothetical protein [Actinomycetospora sp. TBRC 11914]
MADEQHRAVDPADLAPDALGVVGEGGEGEFHGVQIVVSAGAELDDGLAPMGGAAPESVDQDHGGLVGHSASSPRKGRPVTGPRPVRSHIHV